MSALKKLLFAMVTTLLLLAGLEVALRLGTDREALMFTWEKPDGAMFYEDGGNLTMRPDRVDRHHDGPHEWTFTTNAQGYRELEPVPYDKPADTSRFLALGDSWMFGLNATDGATLPDQLEDLLPERLGVGAVEVINAGVAGGGGFDMLRQWRQSTAFAVDGVLLGMPHNDGRQLEQAEARRAWYQSTPGAPASDMRLYLWMRYHLAPYTRAETPRVTEVQTAVADVSLIASEATALGLPVWMVLWPTAWEHVDQPPPIEPWIESMSPYGVTFTGHGLPERACWGYLDDVHPSEAGYRAIAERVADLMAGGENQPSLAAAPRCADVPGDGPGKAGSPEVPSGPSFRTLGKPPPPPDGKMNPPLPDPPRR